MFQRNMAYSVEEAVMTQMESLYHMENWHHHQHPFHGQYNAYSLSNIKAVPSFSTSSNVCQPDADTKHNSWKDDKSLKVAYLIGKLVFLEDPALGTQHFKRFYFRSWLSRKEMWKTA